MAKEQQAKPTLPERKKPTDSLGKKVSDQIDSLIGRLRDVLEEMVAPAPVPVRIPVRSRGYRR